MYKYLFVAKHIHRDANGTIVEPKQYVFYIEESNNHIKIYSGKLDGKKFIIDNSKTFTGKSGYKYNGYRTYDIEHDRVVSFIKIGMNMETYWSRGYSGILNQDDYDGKLYQIK